MASHEKVQLISPGQVRGLVASFAQGIPLDMSSDATQKWIGLSQEEWAEVLERGPVDVVPLVRAQQALYHGHFGIAPDFSDVQIPARRPGLGRLLLFPLSLELSKVIAVYRNLNIQISFPDDGLDAALYWNQRNPQNGSYAIWVRDRQDADEELKYLSPNFIWDNDYTTETLLERLWHGLVYFLETGNHLDKNKTTICTGSRTDNRMAPDVCYSNNGEVIIRWCSPNYYSAGGNVVAREVIAL